METTPSTTAIHPFPPLERQRAVAVNLPDTEEPQGIQRQAAGEPMVSGTLTEVLDTLDYLYESTYPRSIYRHTLIGVAIRLREYASTHHGAHTYETYSDALNDASSTDISQAAANMIVNGVRNAIRQHIATG